MRFINITENKITKVMLDLETLVLSELEFTPEDTVCDLGGDYSNLTFKAVNKFLATLIEDEIKLLATALIDMRYAIAKYGNSFHGAEVCAEELTDILAGLVTNPALKLFEALTAFSDKYVPAENPKGRPQDIPERTLSREEQKMLIAASLLSSLCVMTVRDFETHFSNVPVTEVVLYPVFENAIKADSAAAKRFTEKMRTIMEFANQCLSKRMGLPSDSSRDVVMRMSSLSLVYVNTYMASESKAAEQTINLLGIMLMRNERQAQKAWVRINSYLSAMLNNGMKDVGIDSTIDEDFAKYDAEVCQGMYEFAVDQLKIKIAEAKQKGASEAEITRLKVSVLLITAGVRRCMTVYAYDDRPRVKEKPDVQHYGVASYNIEIRAEYIKLDAFAKGEKQIKEALEA